MHPEIIKTDHLVREAIAAIERAADTAIFERGEFRIGLSGGRTPRPVYEALAKRRDAWEGWVFTFGDERCVPPESEESNFRMVREALFDRAPIPSENILRIRGEDEPAAAAAAYEEHLRARAGVGHLYRHDILLLGMGDDGHTASLFPGTAALAETEKWVTANVVPRLATTRVTLTYPILNAARHVLFLVESKGKEEMLEKVLSGAREFPCNHVRPTQGNLTWIVGV